MNDDHLRVGRECLQAVSYGILPPFPTRNDLRNLPVLKLLDNLLQTIVLIFLADDQKDGADQGRGVEGMEGVGEDRLCLLYTSDAPTIYSV